MATPLNSPGSTPPPAAPRSDAPDFEKIVREIDDRLERYIEHDERLTLCEAIMRHWPALKTALTRSPMPDARVWWRCPMCATKTYTLPPHPDRLGCHCKVDMYPMPVDVSARATPAATYTRQTTDEQRHAVTSFAMNNGSREAVTILVILADLRAAESEVERLRGLGDYVARGAEQSVAIDDMQKHIDSLEAALAEARAERDDAVASEARDWIRVSNESASLRAELAKLRGEAERGKEWDAKQDRKIDALIQAAMNLVDGNPPMPGTNRAASLYRDLQDALDGIAPIVEARRPRAAPSAGEEHTEQGPASSTGERQTSGTSATDAESETGSSPAGAATAAPAPAGQATTPERDPDESAVVLIGAMAKELHKRKREAVDATKDYAQLAALCSAAVSQIASERDTARSELPALRAERDALRTALRPFARVRFSTVGCDNENYSPLILAHQPTIAHYNAARSALSVVAAPQQPETKP